MNRSGENKTRSRATSDSASTAKRQSGRTRNRTGGTAPSRRAEAQPSWRPGQGSTGPRTPEGKERVSRNALKHGLRAQKHVMHDEDAEQFQEYRIALHQELAPLGTVETSLCDRVAQCIWRLRRCMPTEAELFDYERSRIPGETRNLGQVFAHASFQRSDGIALLIRYETSLDRELQRNLKQLRAEQVRRRAEEAELASADRWPRLRPEFPATAGLVPPSGTDPLAAERAGTAEHMETSPPHRAEALPEGGSNEARVEGRTAAAAEASPEAGAEQPAISSGNGRPGPGAARISKQSPPTGNQIALPRASAAGNGGRPPLEDPGRGARAA
jgi:hypothetical protein